MAPIAARPSISSPSNRPAASAAHRAGLEGVFDASRGEIAAVSVNQGGRSNLVAAHLVTDLAAATRHMATFTDPIENQLSLGGWDDTAALVLAPEPVASALLGRTRDPRALPEPLEAVIAEAKARGDSLLIAGAEDGTLNWMTAGAAGGALDVHLQLGLPTLRVIVERASRGQAIR